MKRHTLIVLLTSFQLFAQTDSEGCSVNSILHNSTDNPLASPAKSPCWDALTTPIGKKLTTIKVLHEKEEIVIERTISNPKEICPPFCIEPMTIGAVKTVGELEVLAFIDKLKEKKGRLLIDVRDNTLYEQSTIPGAINLPLFMLDDKSKYQTEVLKLLGAKKKDNRWIFKNAQSLLIFGSSVTQSEASSAIK